MQDLISRQDKPDVSGGQLGQHPEFLWQDETTSTQELPSDYRKLNGINSSILNSRYFGQQCQLRHRWRDGTSYVIFDPMDLLGKLAALVPPPRFNLVRYHGILAPSARWRSRIVPLDSQDGAALRTCPDCSGREGDKVGQGKRHENTGRGHPRNYSWAELMKRVFGFDVLKCDRCGGRMRILCAINPPDAIKKILDCLGLPSRPPPIYPAVSDNPIGQSL